MGGGSGAERGCIQGYGDDWAERFCRPVRGEEFAVIFTDISLPEAYEAVEAMRGQMALMAHPYAGDKPITVSVGLCDYESGNGKELLFRKTDNALYTAKRNGKNAVVTASVSKDDEIFSYA
ncbi:hypothetical protein B9T62_03775 [Paenibacillus donghaensis]|uniref:GGDEF domain-containing protein n=1 Tax=Paenibacillus donghaensis TaxID=414771 RepID=A0A2Z2K5S7_9BACL|nr:hypothetical protein B9T62_03775 [Paenibacillus donghaensis]